MFELHLKYSGGRVDEKFETYLAKKQREANMCVKFGMLVVCFFASKLLLGIYFDFYSLPPVLGEMLETSDEWVQQWLGFYYAVYAEQARIHLFLILWLIISLCTIPIILKRPNPEKWGQLARVDGQDWRLSQALIYLLVENVPIIFGAIYVFTIGFDLTIYAFESFVVSVLGAQIIWCYLLLREINGRNFYEILFGARLILPQKSQDKIRKKFEKRAGSRFSVVTFRLEHGFVLLNVAIFALLYVFLIVQNYRAPEVDPRYEARLYGGYELVWDDNLFFALEGMTAPANVEDFYAYGRQSAYTKFKIFEEMKRYAKINPKYLYEVPKLEGTAVKLNEQAELKINSKNMKKPHCLYNLDWQDNFSCANWDDWQSYVAEHTVMWDRFNALAKLDYVYAPVPMNLGSKMSEINELSQLKAAQIIYLAERGQYDAAMDEWLRFMALYKKLLPSRDTIVNKAVILIAVQAHFHALEKLLHIAPQLAQKYEGDLIAMLSVDPQLFRFDPSDDFGVMEPLMIWHLGNVNAVRNDMNACFDEFDRLSTHSLDAKDIKDCPIQRVMDQESWFLYGAMTPGIFYPNTMMVLLYPGLIKWEHLPQLLKVNEIRFKLAALGVTMRAENVPLENAVSYVEAATEYYNPYTNQPFQWDAEGRYLYFTYGEEGRVVKFRLN